VVIFRSWFCLNRHCRHEWTEADADHPPCPRCGGLRVKWIPGTTGIISGKTKAIDATAKDLIARNPQGVNINYQSPRRGERMMPKVNPVPTGRSRRWQAPGQAGWAIDLPETPNGQLYNQSYCAPAGVTAKLSTAVGTPRGAHKWAATGTGAVPRYEARHRGKVP
jgi:hypothetical protein